MQMHTFSMGWNSTKKNGTLLTKSELLPWWWTSMLVCYQHNGPHAIIYYFTQKRKENTSYDYLAKFKSLCVRTCVRANVLVRLCTHTRCMHTGIHRHARILTHSIPFIIEWRECLPSIFKWFNLQIANEQRAICCVVCATLLQTWIEL